MVRKEHTYMSNREIANLIDKALTEHLSQGTYELMLQVEASQPAARVLRCCDHCVGIGKSHVTRFNLKPDSKRELEQGLRTSRTLVEITRRMIRAYRRGVIAIGGDPPLRYGDPDTLAAIDHEVTMEEAVNYFLEPEKRAYVQELLKSGRIKP